jgi:hypothetical protein
VNDEKFGMQSDSSYCHKSFMKEVFFVKKWIHGGKVHAVYGLSG